MFKVSQKIRFITAITTIFAIVSGIFVRPLAANAFPAFTLAGLPIVSQIIGIRNIVDQALADDKDNILPQSSERKPDKVVNVVMTVYTSTVDQTDDDPFIAASGKHVYDGMLAANWLPLGTKVKIPSLYGDKIFTVDDRMNSRYGYGRMDMWLDTTKEEARKFGVKRFEVEVYFDYNKNK